MKKLNKQDFNELISKVPKDKQPIAEQLIKEIIFISETLSDLKKQIKENGTIEHFQQGKQNFLRESPALKSYNATIQKYSLLYRQLCDLAKTNESEVQNPLLDFVKDGIEQ